MRFIIMHKNDANTEAGHKPPLELVHAMGALIGEYAQSGRFIDGAGLGASATRTRLTLRHREAVVKHGPYRGEHELPATMLLLEVRTRDEALAWAKRYGEILGDGELEVGKVNEPWDIGLVPPPEDPPHHMLLIEKADAATEAGARSSDHAAALSRLRAEMTAAGVLVRTIRLAPSTNARRLTFDRNQLRVTDGPFAESKELIGGFAIIDLADFDEAIALARRYAEILGGTLEIDVRVVDDIA